MFKPVGKEFDEIIQRNSIKICRHSHSIIGPTDMYKYPGANSMNCGWWYFDPELTKMSPEENWYRPRITNSIKTSEMSRYTFYFTFYEYNY